MFHAQSRSPFVMLAVLALASCANADVAYYAPPPGLDAANAVSIVGSKDPKFLLQSSEYRLVWAVDGRPVKDSAFRWDEPLLLTPAEPHRLGLAYGWGGVSGAVDVQFSGKPGTRVVVKGENVDPDREARLWLEDAATGRILGEKQSVRLGYATDATIAQATPVGDIVPIQIGRMKH